MMKSKWIYLGLVLLCSLMGIAEIPVYQLVQIHDNQDSFVVDINIELPEKRMAMDGHIHILTSDDFKIEAQEVKPMVEVELFGEKTMVLRNKGTLSATIIPNADSAQKLDLVIESQLCDDANCYPPEETVFPIELSGSSEKAVAVTEEVMKKEQAEQSDFSLKGKNPLIAVFMLFLLGIISSLSPCIYPMIPITLGLISTEEKLSLKKNFARSFAYVTGMSITYSILGTVFAMLGKSFGSWLSNIYVVIGLTVFFVLMALALLDFYVFNLSFVNNQARKKSSGLVGLLLKGVIAGLVLSPCVGPFLIGILTFISATRQPLLGFIYMLSFGYGMGLLLLVLGMFSSYKNHLPKSGTWMIEIKKMMGLLLFFLPLYYWKNIVSEPVFLILCGGFIFFVPLLTDYLREFLQGSLYEKKWKGFIAFASILGSMLLILSGFSQMQISNSSSAIVASEAEIIINQDTLNAIYSQAQKENKCVILDITASWCVYCKQYDKYMKKKEFQDVLQHFILVKLDADRDQELYQQYQVVGPPEFIFLSPDKKEIDNSRIRGIMPEKKFLQKLELIYENYRSSGQ